MAVVPDEHCCVGEKHMTGISILYTLVFTMFIYMLYIVCNV